MAAAAQEAEQGRDVQLAIYPRHHFFVLHHLSDEHAQAFLSLLVPLRLERRLPWLEPFEGTTVETDL